MDRIVFAHSQSLTHKTHTHTHSPVLTASNRPLHTHPHNSVTHWKQLTSIHWIVQKQPAAGACVCVGAWVFSSHLSLPLLVTRSAPLLFKLVKPIIGLDWFTGPQGCNSSPETSACYISSNTLPPPPPSMLCPACLLTSSTFQSNYSMLI